MAFVWFILEALKWLGSAVENPSLLESDCIGYSFWHDVKIWQRLFRKEEKNRLVLPSKSVVVFTLQLIILNAT